MKNFFNLQIQEIPELLSINESGPFENIFSTSNFDQTVPVQANEQSKLPSDSDSEMTVRIIWMK